MSVPVEVRDLAEHVRDRGAVAYLLTVAHDGRPHAVSIVLSFEAGAFRGEVGNATATNVEQRPLASLLWPARGADDHSLIVDGDASVVGADPWRVAVTPTRAVLHRTASCVQLDVPAR